MITKITRNALILTVAALAIPAIADVTIRKVPQGLSAPAQSFELDGAVYVSLSDFAQQAGFKQSKSVFSRRFTYSNERGSVSFVHDNNFYTVDTVSAILPFPPVRRGGDLYLPAQYIVKAFGGKYPGTLRWDAQAAALTVSTLAYSVLSVKSEVKQNGTLISITLADSLPYEYTYFHPNLIVNFSGAKLDPKAVRRARGAGAVDSVFTVQYDGSAQVSFLLNQPVEAPHIDYSGGKRTLMLSLKPQIEQKKAAPPPVQPDAGGGIRTVVIDPGHGGKDPGAIGPTGVMEKDVVLAIGLELRTMLEKAGFKVLMTRDKDVFIPLIDRTRFANEKRADIFVSVHADAISGDKKRRDAVRGYKIYFLSQAKNEEDKMVAMRENAVIQFEDNSTKRKYDALQDMLISIAGAEYLRESQELGIIMEQTFGTVQKKIPRLQLGVGQANFWVLNGAYMPSVLVEVGFISNSEEEKLLADKRIQYQQAAALSESIVKFREQFEAGL